MRPSEALGPTSGEVVIAPDEVGVVETVPLADRRVWRQNLRVGGTPPRSQRMSNRISTTSSRFLATPAEEFESRSAWPAGIGSDEEVQRLCGQLFSDPGFAAPAFQAHSFRRDYFDESREAAADAREVTEAIRSDQVDE